MKKFCIYSDSVEKAPCISIHTIKYSYLPDFLKDVNRGNKKSFSIPMQISCIKKDESNKLAIEQNRCINCMFCVFGCTGNRVLISKQIKPLELCVDITNEQVNELEQTLFPILFKGKFIEIQPVPFSNLRVEYHSFEEFTAKNETTNIAVWGANALKFLSKSLEPRVSLEVGVDITNRDRNGRLDISIYNINENYLFVAETKISFDAMMNEKRYESQMLAYETELEKACSDKIKRAKFLFIGGKESDLLPFANEDCTGGNNSKYFYDVLRANHFFFVSANAILALGLMKLFISQDKYNLENLYKIINSKKYVGLLSSGIVTQDEQIVPLDNILDKI